QHVGAYELTLVGHARVHRHHRAPADDVAAPALAGVPRPVVVLRRGRARREEACSRDGPSRRRGLQEIAPPEMVLRISVLAKDAHCGFLPRDGPSGMTAPGSFCYCFGRTYTSSRTALLRCDDEVGTGVGRARAGLRPAVRRLLFLFVFLLPP